MYLCIHTTYIWERTPAKSASPSLSRSESSTDFLSQDPASLGQGVSGNLPKVQQRTLKNVYLFKTLGVIYSTIANMLFTIKGTFLLV